MNYTSTAELYQIFLKHPIISKDSRVIPKKCLYFSLKGESFDGNKFAKNAIDQGAAYAIIDNEAEKRGDQYILVKDCLIALQKLANYHRNRLSIPIIAISGSNGKTTTKELIAAVLSKKYKTCFTAGNYNNHIGVPLTLLNISDNDEMAVIEMGANHQGEIDFLCKIAEPTHGLLTNIGKSHLEGFGGIEGVKKGKSELYRYLEKSNGKVFINTDDEILTELQPKTNVISYGKGNTSYCYGSLDTTHPQLTGKWTCNQSNGIIKPKLYGEYNFYNILVAVCLGNYFHVSAPLIDEAINSYESEINRSQIIKKDRYTLYLDAYNANPTSMKLAIENFVQLESKGKLVILGDMFELGEESDSEHKIIKEQLECLTQINKIVLVGLNFYKHKFKSDRILFFESTQEAKTWFETIDKNGLSILLKGSRGMAMEKIIQ